MTSSLADSIVYFLSNPSYFCCNKLVRIGIIRSQPSYSYIYISIYEQMQESLILINRLNY